MQTVSNDQLIRAIFTATDESKTKALAVLEGRESLAAESGPLLLTMGEATKLIPCSRATLWRIVKAGRLEKVELYPGAFRLRRADVVALANGKAVFRG
jgi:hypothetical protein